MQNGFEGIPLAVFTGLSPSGAVAIIVLAVLLLTGWVTPGKARAYVRHLVAVPLAVVWVGFIASATHLGTPANALYAFTNVGSSPLSNEVTAAVAFLFFAGVYWLASFNPDLPPALDKAGLVACIVTGALFLAFTSVVYDVVTVPAWDAPYAPAAMFTAAIGGGLSLVLVVLSIAEAATERVKFLLVGVAAVACAACVIVLVFYVGYLATVGNNVVAPGQHDTPYPVAIFAYAALSALGFALQWASIHFRVYGVRRTVMCGAGCLIVLVAVVMIRVPFYEAYLSVGF